MISADELAERIDPAVAVDRALSPAERAAFLEHCLIGQYEGAQPADWIAQAVDGDEFLARIEWWWDRFGDKALALFMVKYELPEPLTRRLLNAALCVTLGIANARLTTDQRRSHIEIAMGAALWARGYAEALGWAPPAERPDTAN